MSLGCKQNYALKDSLQCAGFDLRFQATRFSKLQVDIRACFSLTGYMSNIFRYFDFCCDYILSLSKPRTITFGLNFFPYFSAKQWNTLPSFFRASVFGDFDQNTLGS